MANSVSCMYSNSSTDIVPISGNVFLNIPTPIINDILARLSPDEVGRCRCVCNAWLELLSDAEFVNIHLSKSKTGLIFHNQSSSPDPDSASFSLVEVEDQTNHHGVRYNARTNREIPISKQKPKSTGLTMIGSLNGLVCINEYAYEYDLIHVWNPIMGDFIEIQTPRVEKRKNPYVVTYGFGINSGKYQVVKIFQKLEVTNTGHCRKILDSTCHVYTLGTAGYWKNIGHAPYFFCRCEHGLFMNGNLHWMVYDDNRLDLICCLDLESESFRPIPPPLELPQSNLAILNVYKGCLSMCDNSDFDIVIWVMKEYGVHNSWTKEVVISKRLINLVRNRYSAIRIIKVFEDGEILLLWGKDKLFLYHPKRKTVQDLDVEDLEATTEYVSSIVSLKNLGELNVNRA